MHEKINIINEKLFRACVLCANDTNEVKQTWGIEQITAVRRAKPISRLSRLRITGTDKYRWLNRKRIVSSPEAGNPWTMNTDTAHDAFVNWYIFWQS